MSHAEQVPQDIRCDTRQANEHGWVAEIVVGHVLNTRVCCEQFGTVVEADANQKRTRFCRAMRKHTRLKFSMNLERGRPVGCALLHAGQRQADLPYCVEVECASWHEPDSRKKIIAEQQLQFGVLCFGFRSFRKSLRNENRRSFCHIRIPDPCAENCGRQVSGAGI
jgi:hypothetical protein